MELLTRKEVQRRLQLTEDELERAVSDGHLTAFRLGERVMYYTREVEALASLFSIDEE